MLACSHFVGRDFGYRNTVALCVIRRTREITAAELERVASFGKEEAEVYLSAHALDPADGGFEIVERVVYDGRDFLDRIAVHSQSIDRLSSDIDCTYDRLIRLGALIRPLLGLGKKDLIAEAAAEAPDLEPRLKRLITRFFQLLAATRKLKALRRKAYAAISGIKKSWFDWLSTREMELARQHGAAVIREDLDIVVPEKETPEYKGPTFARMINHGAKGRYLRQSSEKLRWNGIPEHAVPSLGPSVAWPILHVLFLHQARLGRPQTAPR
jgi:hypothetical protein